MYRFLTIILLSAVLIGNLGAILLGWEPAPFLQLAGPGVVLLGIVAGLPTGLYIMSAENEATSDFRMLITMTSVLASLFIFGTTLQISFGVSYLFVLIITVAGMVYREKTGRLVTIRLNCPCSS